MTNRKVWSRRQFLIGAGTTFSAITGCVGDNESESTEALTTTNRTNTETTQKSTKTEEDTEEPVDEWTVDQLEHDKLIEAHYYPWYGPHGSTPDNWLKLVPGEPVLGEYDSTNEDVINKHIKWALEHGINWFSISWRPRKPREQILNDHFLEAELATEINYSVIYEPIGSAVDPKNPSGVFSLDDEGRVDFDRAENRKTLSRHFQRLENSYFNDSNYARIDGRPVVFIYSASNVTGTVERAYSEAKDAVSVNPYLIASVLGGTHMAGPIHNVDYEWIGQIDAVSAYGGFYDQSVAKSSKYQDFINHGDRLTKQWALVSDHFGLDYIPDLMPGMNDTLVPGRNRPPIERDAEGFRELSRIVSSRLDPDIDALLITSFNEWPEFTAVEPTTSYGKTYLQIIGEEFTRTDKLDYFDPEDHPMLQLRFDHVVTPPNGTHEFGMYLDSLELMDDDGSRIRTHNVGVPAEEPYMLGGVWPPEHTPQDTPPYEIWRPIGGPTAETTIALDPSDNNATKLGIRGISPSFTDETFDVGIYLDGQQTDQMTVTSEDKVHIASLRP